MNSEYRQPALDLALKMLGFENYDEYYNLVAKVADKKSEVFKYWETEDGTKEALVELLGETYADNL